METVRKPAHLALAIATAAFLATTFTNASAQTPCKPRGQHEASAASPEVTGHVDIAQAKPEGTGHVDVAQAKPEGTGHVDVAGAKPEGTGHVDVAGAKREGTTPPDESALPDCP